MVRPARSRAHRSSKAPAPGSDRSPLDATALPMMLCHAQPVADGPNKAVLALANPSMSLPFCPLPLPGRVEPSRPWPMSGMIIGLPVGNACDNCPNRRCSLSGARCRLVLEAVVADCVERSVDQGTKLRVRGRRLKYLTQYPLGDCLAEVMREKFFSRYEEGRGR